MSSRGYLWICGLCVGETGRTLEIALKCPCSWFPTFWHQLSSIIRRRQRPGFGETSSGHWTFDLMSLLSLMSYKRNVHHCPIHMSNWVIGYCSPTFRHYWLILSIISLYLEAMSYEGKMCRVFWWDRHRTLNVAYMNTKGHVGFIIINSNLLIKINYIIFFSISHFIVCYYYATILCIHIYLL